MHVLLAREEEEKKNKLNRKNKTKKNKTEQNQIGYTLGTFYCS